jgi:hypothetical protein
MKEYNFKKLIGRLSIRLVDMPIGSVAHYSSRQSATQSMKRAMKEKPTAIFSWDPNSNPVAVRRDA